MNAWLISAGSLTAVVAAIHLILGHIDPVQPLLRSALADIPKRTLHAVWHLVSVDLVLGALVLLYLGIAHPTGSGLVAAVLAAHFGAYAAVFLALALQLDRPRRVLALPQWLLLLPIAVLSAIGAA
ncbi:hypothetical protein [Arthrobacter sp. CG_A4]|uniref:hypothetical protein n=1 Tax=Arthrobacter sp. CG_A4 TaxID=3071706 RepID=UPI002E0A6385|nr:hypothetical protein [Arthrobacter sp. CG_A4]